jgi:enamine deaminase RidA (YjgF/YER057c/UK114 family)
VDRAAGEAQAPGDPSDAQVAHGIGGKVVEGGLAAQTERAMLTLGLVLDRAGVAEDDLVKLTVYVVDWHPSMYEEFGAGMHAARRERPGRPVPVTVIGVKSLFEPDMLVEVEGVAVAAAPEVGRRSAPRR